jgi:hypothetical protein
MDPAAEPPRLDYATPGSKPVTPTHPVVGTLGFLIYGGLFLLLSAPLIAVCFTLLKGQVIGDDSYLPITILTIIWLFTGWRAFAAIHGVLRRRRK